MKPKFLAGILLSMMIPFFLAGCNAIFLKNSYGNYYSRLSADSYKRETARLTVMTDKKNHAYRPIAHLYLSLLYSSYKNPEKNYVKAHEELKKYVSLHSQAADDYEIQNLLTLLGEINNIREVRLRSKNEELAAENKTLDELVENQKNELLEKENKIRELEETINKLKNLDMELEKKRKSFR